MKLKIFVTLLIVGLIGLIAFSQIKREPLAPARDFPRGALIYLQIADLPGFIKIWNESEFKGKYLESENFQDFKNHHLGLKLASRWEEFNNAAGFPLDSEALSSLSENRASIAVYDIGKLEFVFIAPVNDELFAATKFVQNQDKFEAETLDDGTSVYRVAVEADRGRQKQELIYANAKGRFILATSEKLLVQTLANINGKSKSSSLTDEPAFKALSEKIEPRMATVWVDQTALNEDYYFKRYWLMSDVSKLKNFRAGIFDFSMEDGKLIERRKFLLNQPVNSPPIRIEKAAGILAHLPADGVPFYHLQAANSQTVDWAIQETVFEREEEIPEDSGKKHHRDNSFDYDNNYSDSDSDYSSSNADFDKAINEIDELETAAEKPQAKTDFSKFLQTAKPQSVLTFTRPKILDEPLFAEFQKAAVFNFTSPADFDRDSFERAIKQNFLSQVTISASNEKPNWETKTENNLTWREINLPVINWQASYLISGDELILTNDPNFLREIAGVQNGKKASELGSPLNELTVLNLESKDTNYSRIFAQLKEKNDTDNFFTGNIQSLLDSAEQVKRIEVRRSYSTAFLDEQVTIDFQ